MSEPLPMGDDDVAAMARGAGSAEVARRIKRHSPTKAAGKLVSDKASPPRITAAEMAAIRRAKGRVPDRVRTRLEKAAEADVAARPAPSRKEAPDRAPP